ncbi:MAG: hypothetical protein HQK81_07170 [Desulfovibrionaceae bacterium]|nr:hypothetical protein [Desulfovibrionaceae bacterium]MBF0513832.1 hypothetical protein [Desulfovibrionaceae bacterium]
MIVDHNESLDRIARALGERYRQAPYILNVPGQSVACKVDAFHYLAIQPMFVKYLAQWAAMLPARVEETLLKTGSMLSDASRVKHYHQIRVVEEGGGEAKAIGASFVLATFIDHALSLYGGGERPLPLSGLRIAAGEREALAPFFAGRTPLQDLAFAGD